jgi:hypothetical protein
VNYCPIVLVALVIFAAVAIFFAGGVLFATAAITILVTCTRQQIAGDVLEPVSVLALALPVPVAFGLDRRSSPSNRDSPAPGVAYFAAIAIVGILAAPVLLGSWLHYDNAEPRP